MIRVILCRANAETRVYFLEECSRLSNLRQGFIQAMRNILMTSNKHWAHSAEAIEPSLAGNRTTTTTTTTTDRSLTSSFSYSRVEYLLPITILLRGENNRYPELCKAPGCDGPRSQYTHIPSRMDSMPV